MLAFWLCRRRNQLAQDACWHFDCVDVDSCPQGDVTLCLYHYITPHIRSYNKLEIICEDLQDTVAFQSEELETNVSNNHGVGLLQ